MSSVTGFNKCIPKAWASLPMTEEEVDLDMENYLMNGRIMESTLTLRHSVQSHHHHNNLRAVASTTFPQNPPNPVSSTRALSTLSSPSSPAPSSSASELRKYLCYTALVLFSAAATYYSFLFP
ncbi:hypothetical protein ACFX1R_015741 [Malus domestica]